MAAPRITRHLGLWWVLAAGLLVAFAFVATDHLLRGTVVMGATLGVSAVLRAVAPTERAGGLVVRRRWLDVLILVALGLAIVVSGFTLDLSTRR